MKKTGICSHHFKLKDRTSDEIIDVENGESELRDKLIKVEKGLILVEERKDFLRTNSIENWSVENNLCKGNGLKGLEWDWQSLILNN